MSSYYIKERTVTLQKGRKKNPQMKKSSSSKQSPNTRDINVN